MSRIRLVSFDLDHTLIDFEPLALSALQAKADYLRDKAGFETTPAALQASRDRFAATPEGQHLPFLAQRRAGLAALLGPKLAHHVEPAMARFAKVRFGPAPLMPGAEQILALLARRYTLAALSNGNTDPGDTPLAPHFARVFLEGATPWKKPDPRVFRALCAALEVSPRETVHVGDNLAADVAGARAAGITPVWFNP